MKNLKNETMNEKEFNTLLKELEKKYGKGAIMNFRGGKDANQTNVKSFSSGSFLLDKALGVNGFPVGRIVEVFGPESSGKTTLTLVAIAAAQKQKMVTAFIDAEHAIDVNYAEKIGVNLKDLIISQPDSGEQALEIVDHLVSSAMVDLIVVDSVAALTPIAEIEGSMDDVQVGAQARMLSKALRKISASMSKQEVTVIFINQLREKIGVIFGNPEVTPGGRALKFFSSIRIDIRRKELIRDKENEVIGQKSKVKIVKNKMAAPYREAILEFSFNDGINRVKEILEVATEKNIVSKNGSWYSFKGEKLGQGKDQVTQVIKNNQKMLDEIIKLIEHE